jgi:hypothetical protein
VPANPEAAADRDLVQVAERLFWWQTPQQALADPLRFVAQVMALGTDRDVAVAERRFGTEAFDAVLDQPPPGLFTPRRWNYWHVRQHRSPVPALPTRFLP